MSKKRKALCKICYGKGSYWNKFKNKEVFCTACSGQGYLWTE